MTREEQDRSRWDRSEIQEAAALLAAARRRGRAGPYLLQAEIAACHATAPTAAATDWAQIAVLYEQLRNLAPSPVVELNRAVTIAMADGPAAGLDLAVSIMSGDATATCGRSTAEWCLQAPGSLQSRSSGLTCRLL